MRRLAHCSLVAVLAALLAPLELAAQSTVRVSVDPFGGASNGYTIARDLSANGRLAVMLSSADNLVPGDTNGCKDIFVRDLLTGSTTRVSVDSAGVQANAESSAGRISADGRFVVFTSDATNLVPNDHNGEADVFVHELASGVTTRVSVSSTGAQANGSSGGGDLSADGRFVAFASNATNLVAADLNGRSDVFLRDIHWSATTLISVTAGGVQGDESSFGPEISADGSVIAFVSDADNLIPGDTNHRYDVLVHDVATGALSRVSVSSAGVQGLTYSDSASLSADGRFVAFRSANSNLVPGDTNGDQDVFVHERASAVTTRVSVGSGGVQGDSRSLYPTISADGRFVAFESYAGNLIAGDDNGVPDVFLHDRASGQTQLLSLDSAGILANEWSRDAVLADFGNRVLFSSDATNLAGPDANGVSDVFLRTFALPGTSLARLGACPGPITLTVSNATPHGAVALLQGAAGVFVKPSGVCQGLTLAIAPPQLGALLTANAAGTAVINFWTASACGRTVQAVDVASCTATLAVVL